MNSLLINKSLPEIPKAIFDLATDDADLTYHLRCDELWSNVIDELVDPTFTKRSHYNVGTYDAGCRGPLCRKALRDHPRRKSPTVSDLQLREERIYDPVLEYFHVVMKNRIRIAQQDILDSLKGTR